MTIETRFLGGRFLYRLEGNAIWHNNRRDAHAVGIAEGNRIRPLV
jgi:hypothetical protein